MSNDLSTCLEGLEHCFVIFQGTDDPMNGPDMAHEIDPARTGLLVSVVLCFFFVYIVVILQFGKNSNKYSRFDRPLEVQMEMKKSQPPLPDMSLAWTLKEELEAYIFVYNFVYISSIVG